MAAAIGSSIRCTRRAPAASADSLTALRSTSVMPEGMGDEHARLDQVVPGRSLFDKVAEHFLRDVEVGNDAVLQRPDGP